MDLQYSTLLELLSSKRFKVDQIKQPYLTVLNAPDITNLDFMNRVFQISNMGDIIVAYYFDIETQELLIAGTGTIIYEPKIIHKASMVGHIEDVVVHEQYRKNGVAKNIITQLLNRGKKKNCYKIILNCKDTSEGFYEKHGFEKCGTQMVYTSH